MKNQRFPTKAEAIINLVGGGIITIEGSDEVEYVDGQTPPSEAEIDAELVKIQAEYEASVWSRNRQSEYNALNQFELISDDDVNGTTTHKDAIAAIKTKWPKDNSGPIE